MASALPSTKSPHRDRLSGGPRTPPTVPRPGAGSLCGCLPWGQWPQGQPDSGMSAASRWGLVGSLWPSLAEHGAGMGQCLETALLSHSVSLP